jgi:hypothetical protein
MEHGWDFEDFNPNILTRTFLDVKHLLLEAETGCDWKVQKPSDGSAFSPLTRDFVLSVTRFDTGVLRQAEACFETERNLRPSRL